MCQPCHCQHSQLSNLGAQSLLTYHRAAAAAAKQWVDVMTGAAASVTLGYYMVLNPSQVRSRQCMATRLLAAAQKSGVTSPCRIPVPLQVCRLFSL